MATTASTDTAAAAAMGLGPCVDPLPPPLEPPVKTNQRPLVHASSNAAAETASARASLSATGSFGEATLRYRRSDAAAPSPLAPGLALKVARRSTQATAGAQESVPLMTTTGSSQDPAVATQRSLACHPENSLRRRSACWSVTQEGTGLASADEHRSRTSSVIILGSTFANHPDSAPRAADTAAQHHRLHGRDSSRTRSRQGKRPQLAHRQLPFYCQPMPIQLSRNASWLNGGSGARSGSHVNFSSCRASASRSSLAAAISAPTDPAPRIFATSHWIRAALDVAAAHPQHTATMGKPSRLPQLARRTPHKSESTMQAAAQLHGRRVAAAVKSQAEMREFAAILRRVEAKGGANAWRHLQQRRKRDAGGASAAGRVGGRASSHGRQRPHHRRYGETGDGAKKCPLPCGQAPHRAASPCGSSSTTSHPLRKPSLSGSVAASGEEADEDRASASGVFSEVTELDDDEFIAAVSPSLRTHRAVGSLESRWPRGRPRKAGCAPETAARRASAAADAEAAAAEAVLRRTLYKLHDRTARGMVALQHRRAARTRAGKPVLERELQASQQRLKRAYTCSTGEGGGAGAEVRASPREVTVVAATAVAGPAEAVGPLDGAAVPLKIPVVDDLTALTVSWGGVPDGAQACDDGNESGLASAASSTGSVRGAMQLPEVSGEALPVREERDNSCARISARSGGREGAGPLLAGADTPVTSIAVPDRRRSSLTPLSSLLSNSPLPTANAHTPPSATFHLLGRDMGSPGQAAQIATYCSADASVAAAEEERHLRSELQRLLAEANKCNVYGLHGALRGRPGGCPSKPTGAAEAAGRTGGVGVCAGAAHHSASLLKNNWRRGKELTAPPTPQLPAQSAGGKGASVHVPVTKTTCSAPLAVPASATVAGAQARRSSASSSLPDHSVSSQRRKRRHGAPPERERTNSMSVMSATAATSLSSSLPLLRGSTATAAGSCAVMTPATFPVVSAAGAQAVSIAVTPPPCRPGHSSVFLRRKKLPRHKPLPAIVGVGEHAVGILQHELLVTQRWELEADQAHGRDIECTCAMLQRLHPLREQLIERDISTSTSRAATVRRGGAESGNPQLLMLDPVPASQVVAPLDAELEVAMPLPSTSSHAPGRRTAEAAAMATSSTLQPRNEANAAIARSKVPEAVLHRQRQLIYDEAVRLDTASRLEARAAYLDVLTRLARRHVSSVSWPAVLALLDELRGRLQREVQLAMGAPAAQPAAIASSSSVLAATPKAATIARHSSSSPMSSQPRASVALPAATAAPQPSAQQYGGLQHLIATHLGVLELTQWTVQEVLQHLAALYRVPLSLLHEWVAEQQRHYSQSYNYEERFLAVDRTLAGRAATVEKVLRLTLHHCRRPPLAPPQSPSATAAGGATGCVESFQPPPPCGQEESLYYIRVLSSVQSVASTAVPLSSTAATPFSGAAASAQNFPRPLGDGAGASTMRSLSETASNGAMLPSSSSVRALNFLGQAVMVSVISSAVAAPARSKDYSRRTATRGALRCRSDDSSDADADADMSDAVLAVELMEAGARSPIARGELNLRKCGLHVCGTHRGGGERHAQHVQVALRRKGYRSAELKATLEVL
ncbi:hypothetical protein LSCM1_07988 [Leishmania martiniquensis]|uniref:Uncharacterized protein n=1 Tax=Leishmania martiniquensis TaxID=1580590 RepID=A0A836H6G5_9TRYP|nr:hypothetical protein LSCM1_07988 [Leishmania martiniquensis]